MSSSSNQFHCQSCDTPLKLDDSLKHLNQTQVDLLINKQQNTSFKLENDKLITDLNPIDYIPKNKLDFYNNINKHSQPLHYKNYLESEDEEDEAQEPGNDSSLDSNSYLVLDSDQSLSNNNNTGSESEREIKISDRIANLETVLSILSHNQDINHPLSEDCAQLLIENYKIKFDNLQKQKDQYVSFLKKLKQKDSQLNLFQDGDKINQELLKENLDSKLVESIKKFESLKISEKNNIQELKNLEKVKDELTKELKLHEKELKKLQEIDLNKVMKLKHDLEQKLNTRLDALQELKSVHDSQLKNLDNLRNLNIYKELFNINSTISDNDQIGMINGYRMGYKIVWPEINCAFGQIVLLLMFVMKRLNVRLDTYKLVPLGSQSQIIKINKSSIGDTQESSKRTVLNLYSSDEFSLGKLFNFNKLDVSLIALLEIIQILEANIKQIDPEFDLPYKIRKYLIGNKSIRVSSNHEWSLSCKFLLIDLNWILTFVAAHTKPPQNE